MKYVGISRKVTDIDAPDGMSYFQANTRMHVDQELQRRYGMIRSSLAKAAGPILGFGATNTPNGPIVGSVVSGGMNGDAPITETWHELGFRRPRGKNGVASAPVINLVTYTPTSPRAYAAGVITCTANITYDGLSGPLLYLWQFNFGPALPNPSFDTAAVFMPNFDGFCIPGFYGGDLIVSTTLGGFSSLPYPLAFTVT